MAITRYTASADTTITNAYKSGLATRGTGSNMGESDITEIFSIYSQVSSSTDGASVEKSRALYKFPITAISDDRTANTIPASGSVSFYLRLFNAVHSQTLPRQFTLVASAISQSWDEGEGLDMEGYTDKGYANWISASSTTAWVSEGGNFLTSSDYDYTSNIYTQYFDRGTEDLEIDISDLVEKWIAGTGAGGYDNFGIAVYLTGSQEDGSTSGSFYTKKFFARGTQYFNKRPLIEARWDSAKKDNAGSFYLSSALAPPADNLNNIYLYNNIRGQYQDIPGVGTSHMLVSLYSTLGGDHITLPLGGGVLTNNDANITASWVTTGIYSASFAYTSSGTTTIYPVWHSGSGLGAHVNTIYHTGSAITVKTFGSQNYSTNPEYVTTIKNLKSTYSAEEKPRLRLFIRQKDWSPTIYTKATSVMASEIIDDAYYKVERAIDNLEVISYGTGSTKHTQMSYDISGSYLDLDMSFFEPDYLYNLRFTYYINGQYHEQPEIFKFRVE
tara:strand:+ start:13807 stop:15306 length:1500 start_codon:yes stop_codon:yes gene_type:complete